ncbi:MAG: hypothetical protein ACRDBG_10625, partial [Waterburya sp.]
MIPTLHKFEPTDKSVEFVRQDFDNLVWNKGYEVVWEKAIKCPCKTNGGENLITCLNCGGTGWFFINRFKTTMHLTSMNSSSQQKDWSRVDEGKVMFTAISELEIAQMDRI